MTLSLAPLYAYTTRHPHGDPTHRLWTGTAWLPATPVFKNASWR